MTPAVLDRDVLQCPQCEGTYLHQLTVRVYQRTGTGGGKEPGEDGAGEIIVVNGVTVSRCKATPDMLPGRRQALMIEFECEQCGTAVPYLQIMQHKGQTLVEWVRAPAEEVLDLVEERNSDDPEHG